MKSIIRQSEEIVKPVYPCLKITDAGLVVLFEGQGRGTVVAGGRSWWGLGETCDDWMERYFKFFGGEIVLSND